MGLTGRTDHPTGLGRRARVRAIPASLPWYDERALFRILLALLLLLSTIGNPGFAAATARDAGTCPIGSACGSEEEAKEGCGKTSGCGGGCEKRDGCGRHRPCCARISVWETFAPADGRTHTETPLPLAGIIGALSPVHLPSIALRPPVPPPRAS